MAESAYRAAQRPDDKGRGVWVGDHAFGDLRSPDFRLPTSMVDDREFAISFAMGNGVKASLHDSMTDAELVALELSGDNGRALKRYTLAKA